MIHFYEDLVQLVEKIIDAKSTYDDIKAANDLYEIDCAINNAQPTIGFINAAKQLDRRINEDYPEIEEMHRIGSAMASTREKSNATPYSEYEAILKDLNSDRYGIYVSVLLKHGKIAAIKEFIKSVD